MQCKYYDRIDVPVAKEPEIFWKGRSCRLWHACSAELHGPRALESSPEFRMVRYANWGDSILERIIWDQTFQPYGWRYWRVHKALESLAREIFFFTHPLDQIAYKLKHVIEPFFPPNYLLVYYYLLVLYSSIITKANKKNYDFFFWFFWICIVI